ncbi:MAG: AraC family transcriptional regulator [Clostridia bacterium]|nr:AraC family transcriptional regulator [Clostridia bacterium]
MILDTALRTDYLFNIDAINSVFDFYWDEHYAYSGEYHDFPEIVYVADGEVEATENEHIYHMKKGDLIIHEAMEFHNIRSCGQTKPHVLILSFHTPGVYPENLRDGVFTLSSEEQNIFQDLFYRIYSAFYKNDVPPYLRQSLALELSVFLIRISFNQAQEIKLSTTKSAQEYRKIVETMRTRVNDNITLSELARECHISVSYIKTIFQNQVGISPKLFYTKLRRTEALRLLTGGVSVGEVSERMNFSSPNYFSNFMKKQLGMSITEFLKTKPTITL